jgi:hypothetical protein
MRLLLTAPVLAGLIAAPMASAHADWHRGYGGPRYYGHRGPGVGGIVAGTLLGLGAAAVVAGALAPPPRVYYAPPPVVYAPPSAYAAPPPYYAPPGYYPY